MNEVESLQGSEEKHISQYVEDPSFNLVGLRELFLDLQRLRPTPYNGYQTSHYQEPLYTGVNQHPVDPFQGNQNQQVNGYQQESAQTKNTEKKTTGKKQKKKTKKTGFAFTQRQKLYIIVIALLTLTIIWKVYEALPNKGMLYTSGVLSLLTIVAVVYLFIKRPQEQLLAETEIAATNQQTDNPVHYQGSMGTMANQLNHSHANPYGGQQNHYPIGMEAMSQLKATPTIQPVQEVQQHMEQQMQNVPVQQPVQMIKEHKQSNVNSEKSSTFSLDTNLLVENDDTVLLDDGGEDDIHLNQRTEAYLEIDRAGELEKITLSGNHFTIGRNETAVNYSEDSVGVSRIHIEFIKIENSYGVKDLGSRNGTKLNDESLVPYKIYALNQDDIISIGKVDYQFKWE